MAAIWIDPQGQRRLVLQVFGGGEIGGYDCAILPFDATLIAVCVQRIAYAELIKHNDQDCAGVEFHDSGLEYRQWDYEHTETDTEGNSPPQWELPRDYDNRTACDRMFTEPNGDLRWTARPKHGDEQLETETVTIPQLRAWLTEIEAAVPLDDGNTPEDPDRYLHGDRPPEPLL